MAEVTAGSLCPMLASAVLLWPCVFFSNMSPARPNAAQCYITTTKRLETECHSTLGSWTCTALMASRKLLPWSPLVPCPTMATRPTLAYLTYFVSHCTSLRDTSAGKVSRMPSQAKCNQRFLGKLRFSFVLATCCSVT